MDGPFLREHGELDKIHLKQLRWIHHHINLPNCPIQGWSERLFQKARDSLANDGPVAMLCSRYDLTMDPMSCRYESTWCLACVTIPSASLVRLAEGKAPLIWISSVLPSKSLPSMMTPTGVHQKEKGAKKQTCLKVWMSTFVPCDVVVCSLHLR